MDEMPDARGGKMPADGTRSLVFISHANPEENEFTEWLALQLANAGFSVWSDVTELIGGESFWTDIEEAIRTHTAKFLFVLSRASNTKQGTLDELHLAKTVGGSTGIPDFIIPLRVDDIPYREVNVAIHRLNVIDFTKGWAPGLAKVLEKLEKDRVPKAADQFNPAAVAEWWRQKREGGEILRSTSEPLLSNWFPIQSIPESLWVGPAPRGWKGPAASEYPWIRFKGCVASFASPEEIGLGCRKVETVATKDILSGASTPKMFQPIDAQRSVAVLLREAWTQHIESLGFPATKLANRKTCLVFTSEVLDSKMVTFEIPDFHKGRRSLMGRSRDRYWHFGVTADVRLLPVPVLVARTHVLFSDDGKTIWESSARLHSARRSACKDWWNPHWRDRLLASMHVIAQKGGGSEILVNVAPETRFSVSIAPVTFSSPVSYDDGMAAVTEIDDDPFDREAAKNDETDVEDKD